MSDVSSISEQFRQRLANSHFYPQIAQTQLEQAAGNERMHAFVVLQDMYMDGGGEFRQDLDVYVLTDHRILNWSAHEDNPVEGQNPDEAMNDHVVDALTLHSRIQVTPLRSILDVRTVTKIADPVNYSPGQTPHTVTGFVVLKELEGLAAEPIDCGDEDCHGVHGMSGEMSHASMTIRATIAGNGEQTVQDVEHFFSALSERIASR